MIKEEEKHMEVFGMAGIAFGIIAWGLTAKLRKEFEDLKKNLEDSGVLSRTVPTDS